MPSSRLKELLSGSGLAAGAGLERAAAAAADGAPVTFHLVLEGVDRGALVRALVGGGVPVATDSMVRLLPPELVARLPVTLVRRHHVLPVRLEGSTLHVAMADPFDAEALAAVREGSRAFVQPMAIDPILLVRSLSRYYGLPLPAGLRGADDRLPLPAGTPPALVHEVEEDDVVMVEPGSVDAELAELFRDEVEPVVPLTRKKTAEPVFPPGTEPAPDAFQAMETPLGPRDRAIGRIELQSTAQRSPEAWVAPERVPAPTPIAADGELAAAIETAVHGMREAETRDAVIDFALAYLARAFSRAAVLRVQGRSVLGWRGTGTGEAATLSGLALDLDAPSSVAEAVETGRSRFGPLQVAPGDPILMGHLDPPPLQAALVPVSVAGRVVLVLYGDVYDEAAVLAPRRDLLERLALELGEALEAIIRRKKLG